MIDDDEREGDEKKTSKGALPFPASHGKKKKNKKPRRSHAHGRSCAHAFATYADLRVVHARTRAVEGDTSARRATREAADATGTSPDPAFEEKTRSLCFFLRAVESEIVDEGRERLRLLDSGCGFRLESSLGDDGVASRSR